MWDILSGSSVTWSVPNKSSRSIELSSSMDRAEAGTPDETSELSGVFILDEWFSDSEAGSKDLEEENATGGPDSARRRRV